MADYESSEAGCVYCSCYNLVIKYLEENILTEELIEQHLSQSKSLGEEVDACACNPISVMYTGGTIRPIAGGSMSKVDAIGFHGGKVVASGSKEFVSVKMNNLGVHYERKELSCGQTLLPGLIEPHVHIVATALNMGWNDFSPFDGQELRKVYDVKWLTEEIRKAERKKASWILGVGVDPSLMPFTKSTSGLTKLQRFGPYELDLMEKDIPLFMVSASMHTAYVNSPAIHQIYDSNEEIQQQYTSYQKYWTHVNDRGGLQEMAEMSAGLKAIPKLQIFETVVHLKKNLDSHFKMANEHGVTLMYDAAMSPIMKFALELYCSPLVQKAHKVRIGYARLCKSMQDAEDLGCGSPFTAIILYLLSGHCA